MHICEDVGFLFGFDLDWTRVEPELSLYNPGYAWAIPTWLTV